MYTCQNATLLEITCHSPIIIFTALVVLLFGGEESLVEDNIRNIFVNYFKFGPVVQEEMSFIDSSYL